MPESSFQYFPIKKGFISKMYPWYLPVVDFICLLLPGIFLPKRMARFKLERFFSNQNLLFVDSGKSALVLALRALEIKQGSEVIVPGFVCPEVVDAILTVGVTPVFVDINRAFMIDQVDLQQKITINTACLIITNTYGICDDFEGIKVIADKYKFKIINDLAQPFEVIDRGKYRNNFFGDIAIYSFSYTKLFNTTKGGLVIVRKDSVLKQLDKIVPVERVSYRELFLQHIDRISYYLKFKIISLQQLLPPRFHLINLPSFVEGNDILNFKKIKPKLMHDRTIISLFIKSFQYSRYVRLQKAKIELLNKGISTIKEITTAHKMESIILYYTIIVPDVRTQLGTYLAEHGYPPVWNYVPVYYYDAYKKYKTPLIMSEDFSRKVISIPFRGMSLNKIKKMVMVLRHFYEIQQLHKEDK